MALTTVLRTNVLHCDTPWPLFAAGQNFMMKFRAVAKKTAVFRLDALALSVIATATWLGGWVAVTLRYCSKTAKPIRKLFRPSESPITLVF